MTFFHIYHKKFLVFCLSILVIWPFYASAKNAEIVPDVLAYTQAVASHCLEGQWRGATCLDVLAKSNKYLAAQTIAALKEHNFLAAAETITQECAAGTAIDRGGAAGYSNQTLASAMIACANAFSDVADATAITPDVHHYQLLLAAIYCYQEDQPKCRAVEAGLRAYRQGLQ